MTDGKALRIGQRFLEFSGEFVDSHLGDLQISITTKMRRFLPVSSAFLHQGERIYTPAARSCGTRERSRKPAGTTTECSPAQDRAKATDEAARTTRRGWQAGSRPVRNGRPSRPAGARRDVRRTGRASVRRNLRDAMLAPPEGAQVPVDTAGTIGTTAAEGFNPSSDISGDAGSAMSRIVKLSSSRKKAERADSKTCFSRHCD